MSAQRSGTDDARILLGGLAGMVVADVPLALLQGLFGIFGVGERFVWQHAAAAALLCGGLIGFLPGAYAALCWPWRLGR